MKNKLITTGKQKIYYAFSFTCLVLSLSSCYYDKSELLYPGSNSAVDCSTVAAKFSANVLPLVLNKCSSSGCHDASAAGGVILLTYAQLNAAKDRVKARAIDQKTMPTSGPLLPAEINILKCWIESGAPNN